MDNAKTYYKRALAANNTFMPAMIGLADAEWETGEKAAAQKLYKDIVDRFPDTMVPVRAKTRATEGSTTPTTTSTAEAEGGT